jgi:signal peptidase I
MIRNRRAIGSLLLVAVAGVLLARLAAIQGLLIPVRISGGSMAERLRGEHFQLFCRAYRRRLPERGDLVAFRESDPPLRLAVKRVVGLPGERLSIRHGDLYVDGLLVRKSLEQLRSLAVLVHDSAYEPPPEQDLDFGWRPAVLPSGWSRQADGWAFQPLGAQAGDGLVYAREIADDYGYNRGRTNVPHRAGDLLLVCTLQSDWRGGALTFMMAGGEDRFTVRLSSSERNGRLARNGRDVAGFALPVAAYARGVRFELAHCDRQILLAVDRQVVLEYALPDPARAGSLRDRPVPHLALASEGMAVTGCRLQLYRDLHYTGPNPLDAAWAFPGPVPPGHVFVLGDNVPISVDSRQWSEPGLPLERIVGRVLGGR